MTTVRIRLAAAASAVVLSLAVPSTANADPQRVMAGTVVDFHGKYGLVVRDVRGVLNDVVLHQGTIIKPEGLRLERGMQVIVIGHAATQTFAAGEIDAPLEQWPTARAAAFARTQRDAQRVDATDRNPDPGNASRPRGPDQPLTKEPFR